METLEILGFFGAFIVGLILGLIGSGGSILSVPILVYLFGINPVTATAYSLFIVGTTSLIGSIKNLRDKLINYSTTLLFSFSAVITVYLTRKYLIHLIPETIIDSDLIFLSKNVKHYFDHSMVTTIFTSRYVGPHFQVYDIIYIYMYSTSLSGV